MKSENIIWETLDSAPKNGSDFLFYDGSNYEIIYYCGDSYGDFMSRTGYRAFNIDEGFWAPLPTAPETTLDKPKD